MHFSELAVGVALLAPFVAADIPARRALNVNTKTIPSTYSNDTAVAEWTSTVTGLDGPKLSVIDSTAFDFWYFDVVSNDLKASIAIEFNAVSEGSGLSQSTDITTVLVTGSLPNGTTWVKQLLASEAVVTTVGNGASGVWKGTGSGWTGSTDMSFYSVVIDSPSNGIQATLLMSAEAPARYPCGPVAANVAMAAGPGIGMSNAQPDASTFVSLQVDGTELIFEGVGYHEKNWSNEPFYDSVASWYWGHGRVGGYSIVWLDFVSQYGIEYVSGYVAYKNKILSASCVEKSLIVRPVGSDYPATATSAAPTGFTVAFDLGSAGILDVNVTATSLVFSEGTPYNRWIGSLTASLAGGAVISGGVAQFEEFNFAQ